MTDSLSVGILRCVKATLMKHDIATSRIRSKHKKAAAIHPGAETHIDDMTVLVSRLV